MNSYEALQLLAKVFGVELQYTDNWGRTFQTQPSVLRDILEKKGVRIDPNLLATSPQIITFSADNVRSSVPIYIDVSSTFRDRLLKNGIIHITDYSSKLEPITYDLHWSWDIIRLRPKNRPNPDNGTSSQRSSTG